MKLRKLYNRKSELPNKPAEYFYTDTRYRNIAKFCIRKFAAPLKFKLLNDEDFITDFATNLIMCDMRYDAKKCKEKYNRIQYMLYCGSKLIQSMISTEVDSYKKDMQSYEDLKSSIRPKCHKSVLDELIETEEENLQIARLDRIIDKFEDNEQDVIQRYINKERLQDISDTTSTALNEVTNIVKRFRKRANVLTR